MRTRGGDTGRGRAGGSRLPGRGYGGRKCRSLSHPNNRSSDAIRISWQGIRLGRSRNGSPLLRRGGPSPRFNNRSGTRENTLGVRSMLQQRAASHAVSRHECSGSFRFNPGKPVIGRRALSTQISWRSRYHRRRGRPELRCHHVVNGRRSSIEFRPDNALEPREDRHGDTVGRRTGCLRALSV